MRKIVFLVLFLAFTVPFNAATAAETKQAAGKDVPKGDVSQNTQDPMECMKDHQGILREMAAILKELAKDPALKARAEALDKKIETHFSKYCDMKGQMMHGHMKDGGHGMMHGKDGCPPGDKNCPSMKDCPHHDDGGADKKKP